jgi:hypothetical protein
MTTLAFDTHSFVKRLHDAGFTDQQGIRELELKIEMLRADLKKDIAETKSGLIRWIVGAGLLQTALITDLLIKFSNKL